MRPCDENIRKTLQMTQKMLELANKGDSEREDNGCGILYGLLRDSAYKLRKVAEEEKRAHIKKGWWQKSGIGPNSEPDTPKRRSSV